MNATSKTGKSGQKKSAKHRSGGVSHYMRLLSDAELSPEEQGLLRLNQAAMKKIISKMRAQTLYQLGNEKNGKEQKRLWTYQSILNDLLMELHKHD